MEIKNPFSGDVSQIISPEINPWTFSLKALSQQLGFININSIDSRDAETEKKIIEEVAGYGRQLGWIMEALEVVVNKVDLGKLNREEQAALNRFADLVERVEEVKRGSKHAPLTGETLKRTIEDVLALKKSDKKKYEEMVTIIKDAFSGG